MAIIKVKTKNKRDIERKPRIFFSCHPNDFQQYFGVICEHIFKTHDCAIYYTENMSDTIAEEDKATDLGRNNLLVIPISYNLLTTPNRAMDEDFPYAVKEHIPVLPIMMESNLDELYSSPLRFGELQYLNPLSADSTEIAYEEKLKKHLDSVLISDENAKRVRAAFDAYIFLSYRKKDRGYANELMRIIHGIPEYRNIAIWFDEFLTPGESFIKNIEQVLNACKLFALLVTPRLLERIIDENGNERDNYVMGVELPAAQKLKANKNIDIIAVEMENTDHNALAAAGIVNCITPSNKDTFTSHLVSYISRFGIIPKHDDPTRNYLIGLAYLDGIDIEVDRNRGYRLIKEAADQSYPEAMAKLVSMYTDGVGVSRNTSSALEWSKKLGEYYFNEVFTTEGDVKSPLTIAELFSHYKDHYWESAIKHFLIKADKVLSLSAILALFEQLMALGICEYTLLFETAQNMIFHKVEVQTILVNDILTKSVDGTYPPYGPLFWYVPEYNLYEIAVLGLANMIEHISFAKMLALVRDVCWIFGQHNTVFDVTSQIDGNLLLEKAKKHLCGVRLALCELFYLGKTLYSGSDEIYPRCFNIGECINRRTTGCGLWKRMTIPFEDELGLFEHHSYNELDGEFIGFVSCPYHKPNIEKLFSQKNTFKVRGLALTPTVNTIFTYMSIYRKSISVLYFPENCSKKSRDSLLQLNLIYDSYWSETHLAYFRHQTKLVVPGNIEDVPAYAFSGFHWVQEIVFEEGVKSIGRGAFQGCNSLMKIAFPSTMERMEPRLLLCFALKSIVAPESLYQLVVDRFEKKRNHILSATNLGNGLLEFNISNTRNGRETQPVSLKTNSPMHAGLTDVKAKNTFLQDDSFEGNQEIQKVKLPGSMREIYPRTFKGCVSLCDVLMPRNLESIGQSAFEGCTSLTRIFLPETLKHISAMAFKGCQSLSKVFLPNAVQSVDSQAFASCISLREIQLPPNLVYIAPDAFIDCHSLATIKLPIGFNLPLELSPTTRLKYYQPNTQAVFSTECGDGISGSTSAGIAFKPVDEKQLHILKESSLSKKQYENRLDITTVEIEEGITEIPKSCFAGCSNLHTVKLPSSLVRISASAFANCHNLINIKLPFGLRSINESAFANCRSLSHIKFGKCLLQIGGQAFCGCTSLETLELPVSLRRIGARAFLNCANLQKVHISANFQGELFKIFGDIGLQIVDFEF